MQNINLQFSSSISDIKEINESFDSGILRICYYGRNRNKTDISKSTIESAIPTMFNCPVVCNYDVESNEIGGHDIGIAKNENSLQLVNLTDAIGIIPVGSNYWWETVTEDDGQTKEYLSTEVILWKRSSAYRKIKSDGIAYQSMEINIKNGHLDEDGFFVIEEFVFTAFCLLGKQEPCFESASLQMFNANVPKTQFNKMMRDLKDSISAIQSLKEVTIDITNNSGGGEDTLGVEKDKDKKEFELASNIGDELSRAVSIVTTTSYWGDEIQRYYFVDYDDEAMEVYVWDTQDWLLYGFSYSKDGDSIIIDFDSRQRKKWAIVDFDSAFSEGEESSVFSVVYNSATEKYAENDKQWKEKYELVTNDLKNTNEELTTLRKFKEDIESNENKREREKVFSQFEDLVGVEAFETLREDCEKYSVEDLTEKCFALRGRNTVGKFALNEPKAPKLVVEKTTEPTEKDPYGGVFSEYGID